MSYRASESRYDSMIYRRSGRSGLKLPAVSLGLWHNFGGVDTLENGRAMVHRAFDLGITHFDLANNYGPPPGSAEENFGRIFAKDLSPYRDELIISTKAGHRMWPGPYGEWGSRKYLMASLDQSLKRMGLDYVDIFYSHRFDPGDAAGRDDVALDTAVRSGRRSMRASPITARRRPRGRRHPARSGHALPDPPAGLQHVQPLDGGWPDGHPGRRRHRLHLLLAAGPGHVDQQIPEGDSGRLPCRQAPWLPHGRPVDRRAAGDDSRLNEIAAERGQTLAQMAIAWVLRHPGMTSALVGASRVSQVEDNVAALDNLDFSAEELGKIEAVLGS